MAAVMRLCRRVPFYDPGLPFSWYVCSEPPSNFEDSEYTYEKEDPGQNKVGACTMACLVIMSTH